MKEKLKRIIKNFSQSMLAVYLAAVGLGLLFVDYKEVRWHSHAATLSRLQPPYGYLTQFADGKVPFDRKQLQTYRLFFSQLLRVLLPRPDGYGMLAFCEYHLGNTANAIENYKKAVEYAPYFIWFNYDLGVIYFQKHDYEQAAKYLSEAVRSNADVVLRFMLASKVYMDAITSVPGLDQKLAARLNSGYRDSYKMLVLSYYKLKRFNELIVIADVAVNQKLDDDGFFYYYLGVGAFYSEQFERAALYFREALTKNPQSPEAYYYLALTLKALNKEELAVPALQKAEVLGQAKGPSYETIKNLRLRIF
jgi:tetratricopeptide (TPR) repeat protein